MTKHPAKQRRLIPWLVEHSDFRRNIRRALDRCQKGGVVFIYETIKRGRLEPELYWYCLLPVSYLPEVLLRADKDVKAGRFRRVILARMPRHPFYHE